MLNHPAGLHQLQFAFFLVLLLSELVGGGLVLGKNLRRRWRIRNTVTVTAADGRTMRTMHVFQEGYKEGYDAAYNACVLALRQLTGPERGSIDTVVRHLECYVQQKDRGGALKSNIPARQ